MTEGILALIALVLLLGVPFWFATRKPPADKEDRFATPYSTPPENANLDGVHQAPID